MQQCQAITKNNFRCTRNAVDAEGAQLCRQHQTIEDQKQELEKEAEIKTEADRLSQLGREWRKKRERMPGTLEHYLVTTNFKKPHYGWRKPGTKRSSATWAQETHLQNLLRYAENLFQTPLREIWLRRNWD